MKQPIAAILAGLIFGLGLTISGMSNPAKVLAFLDIAGNWDPSLALVLIGATGLAGLSFRFILRRKQPIFCSRFFVPENSRIERRLIIGAAIFGIGWGLVGFCPGPVYATLILGHWQPYAFFAAMLAGMGAYGLLNARLEGRQEESVEDY